MKDRTKLEPQLVDLIAGLSRPQVEEAVRLLLDYIDAGAWVTSPTPDDRTPPAPGSITVAEVEAAEAEAAREIKGAVHQARKRFAERTGMVLDVGGALGGGIKVEWRAR